MKYRTLKKGEFKIMEKTKIRTLKNQITAKNFSEKLKQIRKSKDWTQKDLAIALNWAVSYRTIQQWEQGYLPRESTIALINLFLEDV